MTGDTKRRSSAEVAAEKRRNNIDFALGWMCGLDREGRAEVRAYLDQLDQEEETR